MLRSNEIYWNSGIVSVFFSVLFCCNTDFLHNKRWWWKEKKGKGFRKLLAALICVIHYVYCLICYVISKSLVTQRQIDRERKKEEERMKERDKEREGEVMQLFSLSRGLTYLRYRITFTNMLSCISVLLMKRVFVLCML